MRIPVHHPSRGVALIIVMIAVITLGILAGGFAYSMKVETTLARNYNEGSEMLWMGRSGVELAKWVISQPGQGGMQMDALNQKWAGGIGDTNSPVSEVPLDNYPLGRGTIAVKIVDLDRKFNVNAIKPEDRQFWNIAFNFICTDASEGQRVLNGILDWIDPDDDTQIGSSDTESSYYLRLNPPYKAKNGPIDDISELMLISGVNSAMFYGSKQSGLLSRGSMHREGGGLRPIEEPVYPVGLVDLFTTLSSGQVNLNTASADVLELLLAQLPSPSEAAHQMIASRAGPDGADGTEDDMPFRGVQEALTRPDTGLTPFAMQLSPLFARFCNVRSTTFEVNVDVQVQSHKQRYTSVLRREGNRLLPLFMYWN